MLFFTVQSRSANIEIADTKLPYDLKKESLLQNDFVSEEEQIIQKTVDINKTLTKDMEKAMAQGKGDFGEINEEKSITIQTILKLSL